jgi:hypothetical protein
VGRDSPGSAPARAAAPLRSSRHPPIALLWRVCVGVDKTGVATSHRGRVSLGTLAACRCRSVAHERVPLAFPVQRAAAATAAVEIGRRATRRRCARMNSGDRRGETAPPFALSFARPRAVTVVGVPRATADTARAAAPERAHVRPPCARVVVSTCIDFDFARSRHHHPPERCRHAPPNSPFARRFTAPSAGRTYVTPPTTAPIRMPAPFP